MRSPAFLLVISATLPCMAPAAGAPAVGDSGSRPDTAARATRAGDSARDTVPAVGKSARILDTVPMAETMPPGNGLPQSQAVLAPQKPGLEGIGSPEAGGKAESAKVARERPTPHAIVATCLGCLQEGRGEDEDPGLDSLAMPEFWKFVKTTSERFVALTREYRKNAHLRGRLTVEVYFDPHGKVKDVQAGENSLNYAGQAHAITEDVRDWHLRAPLDIPKPAFGDYRLKDVTTVQGNRYREATIASVDVSRAFKIAYRFEFDGEPRRFIKWADLSTVFYWVDPVDKTPSPPPRR